MTSQPDLVEIGALNFDTIPCCGIRSSTHAGRRQKLAWIEANAPFGLCAKALFDAGGRESGYIEYIPGEFAWRGVDAAGYLFVHCIWMHAKRHQRNGWGSMMLDTCLADARRAGLHGVAVVVRDGPWLADHRLFLAKGFEKVDAAPPDYHLLVRKLHRAADPRFRKGSDERLVRYGRGLTVIRCSQCPYIAKFASEIVQTAVAEYGIPSRVVSLETSWDAQNAPTPYAVFSVIYNGRLLADHPISRTRFRNIMRSVLP